MESAQHGRAILNEDGKTVTYRPWKNYNGQDQFTYHISDGSGESKAKVLVNVKKSKCKSN